MVAVATIASKDDQRSVHTHILQQKNLNSERVTAESEEHKKNQNSSKYGMLARTTRQQVKGAADIYESEHTTRPPLPHLSPQ